MVYPSLSRVILAFFFNPPPTTEIYTLSLHDALPIYQIYNLPLKDTPDSPEERVLLRNWALILTGITLLLIQGDRKSTRLNSSHMSISYAVFCLKKKNYP